ncbi:MAG TPA: CAP domain-containing protein [Patescibacteria group bacterium]|uniref:SCP domain-containing protein n=1 Tax=Candidatus Amesbacteria bacterium RIFCSPLOWO2_01_FULL_48_25 TaxID=1797259 RepID=A0A1F4ZDL7_9BACT|nr:MAG: hypothetical protein A2989_03905 [Candidatus Amesbacteria bacterium RIFCSPLOWO2_01_FULL_48_25]HJZ05095.1 CAP domain-containing protein [Patescibacteria group bacterium]
MPFLFAIILTLLSLQFTYRIPLLSPAYSLTKPASIPQPTPREFSYVYPNTDPWGQIKKVSDHTYTIRVENDAQMTTADELLSAINNLRQSVGSQPLKTDPRLCDYTQSRAQHFEKIEGTDAHAGFQDFLENEDGFIKLGYGRLGENSSYGFILTGVHLVEWVYMSSPEHNANQLDPAWDHGCAGVAGISTNILFATAPL